MDAIKHYKFNLEGYSKELKCYASDFLQFCDEIEKYPVYRDIFYTFILVEEGETTLKLNGIKNKATPHTMICGLPGELWEWSEDVGIKGKIICFEPEFLMSIIKDPQLMQRYSFLQKDRHNPFIKISDKGFLWIRDILIEIIEGVHPNARQFDLMKAQLWHLILLIEKEYQHNEKRNIELPSKNIISAFIDLVGKELYRHHNTSYYAEQLCITSNYLNKIVNKSLGISALAYIQNRIMTEAKVLLSITELNINEIAQALGFESGNYFIRFFKKYNGMTPGEYRKARFSSDSHR